MIYKQVSGTWKPAQHMFKNVAGTWKKVRKMFRNNAGTWTQYHGDQDIVAYSLGLIQNLVSASVLGVTYNGGSTATYAGGRSYNLVQFDKYGNITFSRQYDIFGEATGGAPTATTYGSAQFAADTAAMATGQKFLLFTYDEPQSGDMVDPITAFINAVLSIGGTSAVFQSSSFAYRGAYMLLGAKGSAATFEAYRGTEGTYGSNTGCQDGAIGISFTILNGSYINLTRIM